MGFDILRYRAHLNQNRELFLLNDKVELASFDLLDKALLRLASAVGGATVPGLKQAVHISPLFHLMLRQSRNAFDSVTAYQSHQAWNAIRPFVEAPLIAGKWFDDPRSAVVWMSRNSGKASRKEYKDAYSGDSMKPQSLPNAEAIRNLLVRLDDDFIYTNARFYTRAVGFAGDGGRPSNPLADAQESDPDHRAHLSALLHMHWFVLKSAGQMLAAKLGDKPDFKIELEKFQKEFSAAAAAIANQNDIHKTVLTTLGLWPNEFLQSPRPV